jgi:hypothetical protein
LFIPQIQKIEAERTLFIPQIGKIVATNWKDCSEAKNVYSTNWKDRSEAKSVYSTNSKRLIPKIGKIEAKKTNWIKVKRTEAVFLKLLWSPGIDSKEFILQAYALAGLYIVQQPYSSSVPSPLRLF